jgi:hypothetical protein
MAYAFMAESPKAVDWPALHGAVLPIRKRVELFPIPAANGTAPTARRTSSTRARCTTR